MPRSIRSTAYGAFAAVVGVGTALGGTIAGGLYEISLPTLITVTLIVQAAALVIGVVTLKGKPGQRVPDSGIDAPTGGSRP